MLFTGEVLTPWGDAPRVNRLIFIGKNLDRQALERGFDACLENPPEPKPAEAATAATAAATETAPPEKA